MARIHELLCELPDAQEQEKVVHLLQALSLTLKSSAQSCDGQYCLALNESGLSLQKPSDKKMGGLMVDFVSGAVAYRRHHGGGTGQAVAKAIGLKQAKRTLSVLDATAGMGTDSFILASLGCQVTLFERNPYVAALLLDGLDRASGQPDVHVVTQNMNLLNTNSTTWMSDQAQSAHPQLFDVVYLDPMFPHTGKSAQVKKAMQYFRDIVGKDEDADALLEPALTLARLRVVVKRPKNSPYLNARTPTLSLEGKANRFDIYVNKSITSSLD